MKKWFLSTLGLLVAIAIPALANAKGDAAAGKTVFEKRCATCHGPAGEGKEAIAKMMKTTMHPLGSKEVQAKSDAELAKVITSGTGKMKPVTGLSTAEVDNLVAFIRSLAKK